MKQFLPSHELVQACPQGRMLAVVDWCKSVLESKDLQIGDSHRLMNVGCGFGWLEMIGLAEGWPVTFMSIEPTESDLKVYQTFVDSEFAFPVVGSGLKIPFRSESISVAVISEVMEHIPKNSESQLFSEVFRLLMPGGVGLFTTPKKTFRSCLGDPAYWTIGHRHYSIAEIEKFANDSGFNVLEVSTRGGWVELFSMLDLYISKWIFRRRPIFGTKFSNSLDSEWAGESNGNFMGLWMVVQRPRG
jgi:SAM-dependent methyltransferase